MKFEELKKIVENRNDYGWSLGDSIGCEKDLMFIQNVDNHIDELLAVVEAVHNYFDNHFVLRLTEPETKMQEALKKLEEK